MKEKTKVIDKKLKNINSNGDNNDSSNVNFLYLFFKLWKLKFLNMECMLIFLWITLITCKI